MVFEAVDIIVVNANLQVGFDPSPCRLSLLPAGEGAGPVGCLDGGRGLPEQSREPAGPVQGLLPPGTGGKYQGKEEADGD